MDPSAKPVLNPNVKVTCFDTCRRSFHLQYHMKAPENTLRLSSSLDSAQQKGVNEMGGQSGFLSSGALFRQKPPKRKGNNTGPRRSSALASSALSHRPKSSGGCGRKPARRTRHQAFPQLMGWQLIEDERLGGGTRQIQQGLVVHKRC